MSTRKTLAALLLVPSLLLPALCAGSLTLAGCGDKNKADKADKEEDTSDSAEPKKKGKKKKDDDKPKQAAVEVVLPNVETREVKPQKLGDKELKAELCKFDKAGGEMSHEWFHKALRDAALAADGSLYLLDHEVKVRKYRNQKEGGCELALDKSFGKDGILDIGEKPDGFADRISVDKAGAVYVNTSPTKKIVDGKATEFCGSIVAGPESDVVLDGKRVVKGGKCGEGDEIKFQAWDKDAYPDVLAVLADGYLVKGSSKEGDKNVIQVGLFGLDGAKKALVGKADGDESICFAHGAAMINGNLAVVDGNCRALRVWKGDGTFISKVDLDDLSGLSIMPRILEVGKGEVFVIGSADKKDDSKLDLGVVVRVTGF